MDNIQIHIVNNKQQKIINQKKLRREQRYKAKRQKGGSNNNVRPNQRFQQVDPHHLDLNLSQDPKYQKQEVRKKIAKQNDQKHKRVVDKSTKKSDAGQQNYDQVQQKDISQQNKDDIQNQQDQQIATKQGQQIDKKQGQKITKRPINDKRNINNGKQQADKQNNDSEQKLEYENQKIDKEYFKNDGKMEENKDENNQQAFQKESFADLEINRRLKISLEKAKYEKLTFIQKKGIPMIMGRQNVAVKSQTGSGKTLTYLVPLLNELGNEPKNISRNDGVFSIILCPTRELCQQISEVATVLTKSLIWIVPGAVFGGENPQKEKARIRKGINILVGTPGRLLYHLKNTECLRLDNLRHFVFEEADRILDMGFKKDLDQILELIEKKKQMQKVQKILISATYSYKVKQLQKQVSQNQQMHLVGFSKKDEEEREASKEECEEALQIPSSLQQKYVLLQENEKISFLVSFLKQLEKNKVIVFVQTIDEVEFIALQLQKMTFRDKQDQISSTRILSQEIYKLHGDIEQKVRSTVYFDFKKTDNSAILIATEVASRGLDMQHVSHSILLDPPSSLADYVNKIGRTARINHQGISLLVLFECEKQFINNLDQKQVQIEPILKLEYFGKLRRILENEWQVMNQNITYYIQSLVKYILNLSNENYYLARKAYNSYIRAYTRLPDKQIFNVKQLNLYQLGKCFGLSKVQSRDKETKNELYQKDLIKRQAPNERQPKSRMWLDKRKVLDNKTISNMEFM